jgi:hypothetical protein
MNQKTIFFVCLLVTVVFYSCDLLHLQNDDNSNSDSSSSSDKAVLKITDIPGNLRSDDNALLVFVLNGYNQFGYTDFIMGHSWASSTAKINGDTVTADLKRGSVFQKTASEIAEFSDWRGGDNWKILLAAPKGSDWENWSFWIYSDGRILDFNSWQIDASPGLTILEAEVTTVSWDQFQQIALGVSADESTVDLSSYPLGDKLPSGSLEEKLHSISQNTRSGVLYSITIENDITLSPQTITTMGKNVVVQMRSESSGSRKTITLGSPGSLFTTGSPITLVLTDIILKGQPGNTAPLVYINSNGRVKLDTGALITGNINTVSNGGGVYVENGVLIIDGGEINDNTATYPGYSEVGSGGGVYVGMYGTLFLKSGRIMRNTASENGGGVYVNRSKFFMTGGEIGGNKAWYGGGVYAADSSVWWGGGVFGGPQVDFTKAPAEGSETSGIIYGSTGPEGIYNYANGPTVWYGRYKIERMLGEYDHITTHKRWLEDFYGWDYMNDNFQDTALINTSDTVDLSGLSVQSLPSGDLAASFSTIAQRADRNVLYDITINNDMTLAPQQLMTRGKNVVIRIQSATSDIKTITLTGQGYLFYVDSSVTLILKNIKLRGTTDNSAALIAAEIDATIKIEPGAVISDNINTEGTGGGVFIGIGGHLIMDGGEISNNQSTHSEYGSGGGVFLNKTGIFHFKNGTIRDNYADEEGGGVCAYFATFIMNNGEIYGNSGFQGGGIYLDGSTFKKEPAFGSTVSGKIYDNTIPVGKTKRRGDGLFSVTASAIGHNVYHTSGYGSDESIDEYASMYSAELNQSPWKRF